MKEKIEQLSRTIKQKEEELREEKRMLELLKQRYRKDLEARRDKIAEEAFTKLFREVFSVYPVTVVDPVEGEVQLEICTDHAFSPKVREVLSKMTDDTVIVKNGWDSHHNFKPVVNVTFPYNKLKDVMDGLTLKPKKATEAKLAADLAKTTAYKEGLDLAKAETTPTASSAIDFNKKVLKLGQLFGQLFDVFALTDTRRAPTSSKISMEVESDNDISGRIHEILDDPTDNLLTITEIKGRYPPRFTLQFPCEKLDLVLTLLQERIDKYGKASEKIFPRIR